MCERVNVCWCCLCYGIGRVLAPSVEITWRRFLGNSSGHLALNSLGPATKRSPPSHPEFHSCCTVAPTKWQSSSQCISLIPRCLFFLCFVILKSELIMKSQGTFFNSSPKADIHTHLMAALKLRNVVFLCVWALQLDWNLFMGRGCFTCHFVRLRQHGASNTVSNI